VPLEEASRFGIMNTKENGEIYEFEEKPQVPKSTNASMGVYIFKWSLLKEFLKEDESDKDSFNDFGKNIIPNMLNEGKRLIAYPFKGYWKDVGTIESLWQANMDLLNMDNDLNLYDKKWKIYSQNLVRPAHYVGNKAKIVNSLIVEGCIINGEIKNSIISQGVTVGNNTIIRDSVIMPNAKIGNNVYIEKSIIGSNAIVDDDYEVYKQGSIEVVGAYRYVGNNIALKEISLDEVNIEEFQYSTVGGRYNE
jgi:glucose-1-phosphate adenylyltransferase